MVKEAYCSYEVAKLLKERGFNEECHYAYHYWPTGAFFHRKKKNFNGSEYQGLNYEWFSCPTHQLACAWVRKRGWHISVQISYDDDYNEVYYVTISSTRTFLGADIGELDDKYFSTVEEATEAALEYSLRNFV